MANAELLHGTGHELLHIGKYVKSNGLHSIGFAAARQEWKEGRAEAKNNGKRFGFVTGLRRGTEGFVGSFLLPSTFTAVTTSKGKLEKARKFVGGLGLDAASYAVFAPLIGVAISQPWLAPILGLLVWKVGVNGVEHIIMDTLHIKNTERKLRRGKK